MPSEHVQLVMRAASGGPSHANLYLRLLWASPAAFAAATDTAAPTDAATAHTDDTFTADTIQMIESVLLYICCWYFYCYS